MSSNNQPSSSANNTIYWIKCVFVWVCGGGGYKTNMNIIQMYISDKVGTGASDCRFENYSSSEKLIILMKVHRVREGVICINTLYLKGPNNDISKWLQFKKYCSKALKNFIKFESKIGARVKCSILAIFSRFVRGMIISRKFKTGPNPPVIFLRVLLESKTCKVDIF